MDKYSLVRQGAGMVGADEVGSLSRRLEMLEMRLGLGKEEPRKGIVSEEEEDIENCLFVGNLDNSRDAAELRLSVLQHFSQLGKVSSVRISRDNSNRPYALVYFDKPGQADAILKKGKNTVLEGRHLRVEKSRTNCSIYIDSIPSKMNATEVRTYLQQFGTVREFNLLGPNYSRLPHSLAYVTYSTRASALFALATIKQTTSWKADLKIETKPVLTTSYDHRSIYVGKLNPEFVSPKLVVERFRHYGSIDHLLLLVHPSQALACCYIKFNSPSSCYSAVRSENGSMWLGNAIRVEMKRADP